MCVNQDSEVGTPEANVVCRQMFQNEKYREIYLGTHRPIDGESSLQLISCGGWEFSLTDCDHNGWSPCYEELTLSVECAPESKKQYTCRLL